MAIDGFDDADFQELAPKAKRTATADMIVSTVSARQPGNEKVQFNIAASLIEEIDADGRFAIAYAPAKKAFRLKPDPAGRFELITLPRGTGRFFLRVPLPPGLAEAEGKFEPEFYVDAIGRVIIVECPEELQSKPKLLAPPAPQYPAVERSGTPARHPGADITDAKVMQAALGVGQRVPTTIQGQKFTLAEATVVELLSKRELVTKAAVMAATADPEKPGEDDRDDKLADVLICKVRPKMAEFGIPVHTEHGQGWRVSGPHRQKLKNLIELARMDEEEGA